MESRTPLVDGREVDGRAPPRDTIEEVWRVVRHEVGDFLQTVYAMTALLQRRLPPEAQEDREMVANLRARAEGCKYLLEGTHEFLAPRTLACCEVNLSALARKLVTAAAPRHASLEMLATSVNEVCCWGDPNLLAHCGSLLLAHACAGAQQRVEFHARQQETGAEWLIMDDGPCLGSVQLETLFDVGGRNRQGRLVLDLPLARKIVVLHQGQVSASNLFSGGLSIEVRLPFHCEQPGSAPR